MLFPWLGVNFCPWEGMALLLRITLRLGAGLLLFPELPLLLPLLLSQQN